MKNKRVLLTSIAFVITMLLVVLFFVLWKWNSSNYSPEVDAAIITAFVTVPITFLTLVGTVGVTYYFNQKMLDTTMKYNQKTIELSIQQQRTTARDKLLEYRLEKYQELFRNTMNAVTDLEMFLDRTTDEYRQSYQQYIQWIDNFYVYNSFYLSQKVNFLISYFLISRGLKNKTNEEKDILRFKEVYEKIDNLLADKDHINKVKTEFPKLNDEIINEMRFDFFEFNEIFRLLTHEWVKENLDLDTKDEHDKDKLILYRFMGKVFKSRTEIVTSTNYLNDFRLFSHHLQYIMFNELNMKAVDEDMKGLQGNQTNIWD
ncbi:hypothetical protein [Shimazuella kribbensis]|uniref:hypothetical protein n=1 Tax=Shimazuella kribbensis TaxID=139808 RepID=UPI0004038A90|nr:hypothetical protein [Shimazuella kribbensis]